MASRRSSAVGSLSAQIPASSIRSMPRPVACTGRSAPTRVCAPHRQWGRERRVMPTCCTSATSARMSTPSMPKPAGRSGKNGSIGTQSRGSRARPNSPTGDSTCRCRRSKNRARGTHRTHAARFVAAWLPTTRRPASPSGNPLPSRPSRGAARSRRRARNCGRPPAPGCGRRLRSISQRRVVYVATGNGYTEPADEASDAVIAYDIDSGKRLWVKQVMAADRVRARLSRHLPSQCAHGRTSPRPAPTNSGPTWISATRQSCARCPTARRYIVIGQKDGHAWAPRSRQQGRRGVEPPIGLGVGERRRRHDVGLGGRQSLRILSCDASRRSTWLGGRRSHQWRSGVACEACGGWRRARDGDPRRCIPGVEHRDRLRVTRPPTASAIWNFDTAREFETVNGVQAPRREHQCRRSGGRRGDAVRALRLLRSRRGSPRQRAAGVRRRAATTAVRPGIVCVPVPSERS